MQATDSGLHCKHSNDKSNQILIPSERLMRNRFYLVGDDVMQIKWHLHYIYLICKSDYQLEFWYYKKVLRCKYCSPRQVSDVFPTPVSNWSHPGQSFRKSILQLTNYICINSLTYLPGKLRQSYFCQLSDFVFSLGYQSQPSLCSFSSGVTFKLSLDPYSAAISIK